MVFQQRLKKCFCIGAWPLLVLKPFCHPVNKPGEWLSGPRPVSEAITPPSPDQKLPVSPGNHEN